MDHIDSQLTDFTDFILSIADLTADDYSGRGIQISEMTLSFPIELETLIDEPDRVQIETGPPTQQIQTSFMPIFHQIRLKLVAQDG